MRTVAHFRSIESATQGREHLRSLGFIPYINGNASRGYEILVMPAHEKKAREAVNHFTERPQAPEIPPEVVSPTKEVHP